MSEVIIEFRNITKTFPGVTALSDVSFTIDRSEVHALMGENGAGKSTLMNILFGVYRAEYGSVYIDGEEIDFASPHEALKYGVSKAHQEISTVDALTVGQNIMLGFEPVTGIVVDRNKINNTVNVILRELGCHFTGESRISDLRTGDLQMVAIAKAIYHNSKIIAFDEPTSALSAAEVETLFSTIRSLKDKGITVIIVTHKMDEVFKIADRVSVLRDGRYMGTRAIGSITQAELIRMMVGRDAAAFATRHLPSSLDRSTVTLEVRELSGFGFSDVSFKLHKGEILSLYGLIGAGRTEIVRAIFGVDHHAVGEIAVFGKPVNIRTPADALRHGIGLLPEERKTQGFIHVLSNPLNIALPNLKSFTARGIVQKKKIRENFDEMAKVVQLNNKDPNTLTHNLSGGNQQKVIVAKWLSSGAKILIFDEPTKGIDIGAKEEIYLLMEKFVAEGNSIIMVSSELPEVIGISDRVLVVKNGRIINELEAPNISEDRIMNSIMEENNEK